MHAMLYFCAVKKAKSVFFSLVALLTSLALATEVPPVAVVYTPFSDAEPVLDAGLTCEASTRSNPTFLLGLACDRACPCPYHKNR